MQRFFEFTGASIEDLGYKNKFKNAYLKIFDRQITTETKIKYLKILRNFSDFLIEENVISENVAKKHPTPRKKSKTIRESFDKNEIVEIFHFLDDYYYEQSWLDRYGIYDRNRLMIFIFLYTGIRRSELVHIRINHIHKEYIFIEGGK